MNSCRRRGVCTAPSSSRLVSRPPARGRSTGIPGSRTESASAVDNQGTAEAVPTHRHRIGCQDNGLRKRQRRSRSSRDPTTCPTAVVGPGDGRDTVSPLRTAAMPLAGVALLSLASSVVGGVKRFQQLADTGLLSQNLHCPDDGAGQARSRIVIDAGRRPHDHRQLIDCSGGWVVEQRGNGTRDNPPT